VSTSSPNFKPFHSSRTPGAQACLSCAPNTFSRAILTYPSPITTNLPNLPSSPFPHFRRFFASAATLTAPPLCHSRTLSSCRKLQKLRLTQLPRPAPRQPKPKCQSQPQRPLPRPRGAASRRRRRVRCRHNRPLPRDSHIDRELDPNAPKRGLSAYMFFANEQRESVREENPGITFGTPTPSFDQVDLR
jgi:hypothetical protein